MSGADVKVITVRWKNRWFRTPILSVEEDKTQRKYELVKDSVPGLDEVRLRTNGAAKRFDRFLAESRLSAEFANACADGEPAFFLFDLHDGPWTLPWELVLADLLNDQAKAAYTPARIAASFAPFRPWKHAERLRVLIIEGFPGEIPNRIRPDLEAAGIEEAWESLDPHIRDRIERPKRTSLDPRKLSDLLKSELPHILWYCGHGRSNPSPGLLFDRNSWMSVGDFAAAVPQNAPPLCVALWACELAESSPDQDATAPAPQIHPALAQRGVRATLAMQSRVNDVIARSMAKELFSGLAIGLSLERAAARARRFGFALPSAGFDWASPAVWLAQAPLKNWEWGAVPPGPLLERLIASLTVKQSQKTVEIDPRSGNAVEVAKSWNERKRVILLCDLNSEATKIELARIADAAFNLSNSMPVFISMENASPIASISDWAREILSWCEAEMLPTSLGSAIRFAVEDAYSTPRRLLDLEECMLVFINPPRDKDAEWFLNTLASSRRRAPIVLITGRDEGARETRSQPSLPFAC